jgi:glycerol uptake facilitator-like aquaporin
LQVPAYIIAQVVGSTLASGALKLIFNGKENQFAGTLPAGSDLQAFVVEFIITFFLMFIISGVATDNRAVIFLKKKNAWFIILIDTYIFIKHFDEDLRYANNLYEMKNHLAEIKLTFSFKNNKKVH